MLVCAGLANTHDCLYEAGITRYEHRHVISLGRLSHQATLQAATQSLRVIVGTGIEGHDKTLYSLAERIAEASDHWPRHLTCYLHGVCEMLITQRAPSLAKVDIEKTLEKGHQLRQDYYQQRLQRSGLPASIVSAFYERVDKEPISRKAAASILKRAMDDNTSEEAEELRNDFPQGRDAFNQALQAGIVTINDKDVCEIPIPSMRDFVIETDRATQALTCTAK